MKVMELLITKEEMVSADLLDFANRRGLDIKTVMAFKEIGESAGRVTEAALLESLENAEFVEI